MLASRPKYERGSTSRPPVYAHEPPRQVSMHFLTILFYTYLYNRHIYRHVLRKVTTLNETAKTGGHMTLIIGEVQSLFL